MCVCVYIYIYVVLAAGGGAQAWPAPRCEDGARSTSPEEVSVALLV